jgi:hypothetical protein
MTTRIGYSDEAKAKLNDPVRLKQEFLYPLWTFVEGKGVYGGTYWHIPNIDRNMYDYPSQLDVYTTRTPLLSADGETPLRVAYTQAAGVLAKVSEIYGIKTDDKHEMSAYSAYTRAMRASSMGLKSKWTLPEAEWLRLTAFPCPLNGEKPINAWPEDYHRYHIAEDLFGPASRPIARERWENIYSVAKGVVPANTDDGMAFIRPVRLETRDNHSRKRQRDVLSDLPTAADAPHPTNPFR